MNVINICSWDEKKFEGVENREGQRPNEHYDAGPRGDVCLVNRYIVIAIAKILLLAYNISTDTTSRTSRPNDVD
jgi:hypothetical protein